jgi:hypothetical protein
MLTPIDSKKIREEIARKYESDPKRWRFLWNIDDRGRYNLVIAKGSKLWWLKEEMINPLLSVGCGVRSPLEEDLMHSVFGGKDTGPSYGFRPVREEQMKRIIVDLSAGKDPQMPLSEILRSEPVALKEVDSSIMMQGPFYHAARFTDLLSDKQRELDAKLNTELEKLVLKRYPQLRMSYT